MMAHIKVYNTKLERLKRYYANEVTKLEIELDERLQESITYSNKIAKNVRKRVKVLAALAEKAGHSNDGAAGEDGVKCSKSASTDTSEVRRRNQFYICSIR